MGSALGLGCADVERDLPCLEVVICTAPAVGEAFGISAASDDMDGLLP